MLSPDTSVTVMADLSTLNRPKPPASSALWKTRRALDGLAWWWAVEVSAKFDEPITKYSMDEVEAEPVRVEAEWAVSVMCCVL